jgi:hypothetical protein
MYHHESLGVNTVDLTVLNQFENVLGLTEQINNDISISPNTANGTFTMINGGGIFWVAAAASISADGGAISHMAFFVNGSAELATELQRDISNANDVGSLGGMVPVTIPAGAVCRLKVNSDTVPRTITLNHLQFSMMRIG